MIPEPGDTNREVLVNETFHIQTDDELTEKELKQIEADDQAIQTILLVLPEDIYAAVDSCETAQEIRVRVQQMMKGSDIGIQEKKAKLFNEWERVQNIRNQNGQIGVPGNANQNGKGNLVAARAEEEKRCYLSSDSIADCSEGREDQYTELLEPISESHQVPQNDNNIISERISSNPRNRQIAQPGMNMGQDRQMQMVGGNGKNQFRQYVGQNVGNLNGYNAVQNVRNQVAQNPRVQNVGNQNGQIGVPGNANLNGNGNLVAARAEGNTAGQNRNQIRCYNYRGMGHFARNCTQALTSGTQTDKAPIYDLDGSAEVHDYENCDDNEIFNMFTQKEQYTELLEPIPEQHQVPQNDNNVISEVTSVEQSRETVEQHPVNFEETRALYDSLYHNLAIEIEKVNYVNRKLKETNADLTTELARFKNQEKCFEISQEKYDKLERCYQQSVYQEQCLSKKIYALHLSFERFENCIIKKENEYAKLWNDWYKKCDECKYDKISYDKAYKDMQQKIERLQAQLGDLKGKSKDTSYVSDTLNPLSQKLKNENVELEFQVLNYARENAHLKITYKNLFDFIFVSRTQTKTIIVSMQKELQSTIYENAKLRAQLFKKVSVQIDIIRGMSKNTKFAKQSILGKPPMLGEIHALSKPVTSNSVPTPQESKVMKNDKVIAPGMFRITPFKASREEKHVPNNVRASARTKSITVSQPLVITKKYVNSDSNGYPDLFMVCRLRVYFIERLGHNLFSVGQFCDSNLKVAFRRNACFIRNLEGVNLLKGDHSTNLYTINLHEMASASPICLMARASSTKSWLWHQRLSHLNFDTINDLARNNLVFGLLKFKYNKEHLCPSCEQGKIKRASHPPKPVLNSRQRLHLLHMDLCGPMRIASINGKRYVLVIVDDYSRYTWVHFLRSKDEAPEVIKTILKRITVLIQSPVINIRTDNGIEFKNQAIATARFTQNRSIIHRHFNKMPYELINSIKPDISFLHVFGALCYPKNDREDIGKLGAKGDIGFFIGYYADSCAYRVYNQRTKKIIETMNVLFDELLAMAFEQHSSKLGLQCMTSGQISSGLDLTYAPSTITTQQPSEGELDLLFEAMYDDYIGG
nr:retrovirus-related Pol polyprotein from transposon TNT 1-94 [Tanacetum cinerariifolium]